MSSIGEEELAALVRRDPTGADVVVIDATRSSKDGTVTLKLQYTGGARGAFTLKHFQLPKSWNDNIFQQALIKKQFHPEVLQQIDFNTHRLRVGSWTGLVRIPGDMGPVSTKPVEMWVALKKKILQFHLDKAKSDHAAEADRAEAAASLAVAEDASLATATQREQAVRDLVAEDLARFEQRYNLPLRLIRETTHNTVMIGLLNDNPANYWFDVEFQNIPRWILTKLAQNRSFSAVAADLPRRANAAQQSRKRRYEGDVNDALSQGLGPVSGQEMRKNLLPPARFTRRLPIVDYTQDEPLPPRDPKNKKKEEEKPYSNFDEKNIDRQRFAALRNLPPEEADRQRKLLFQEIQRRLRQDRLKKIAKKMRGKTIKKNKTRRGRAKKAVSRKLQRLIEQVVENKIKKALASAEPLDSERIRDIKARLNTLPTKLAKHEYARRRALLENELAQAEQELLPARYSAPILARQGQAAEALRNAREQGDTGNAAAEYQPDYYDDYQTDDSEKDFETFDPYSRSYELPSGEPASRPEEAAPFQYDPGDEYDPGENIYDMYEDRYEVGTAENPQNIEDEVGTAANPQEISDDDEPPNKTQRTRR